ncbi:MAG: ubiquinone biosynthesis regulatory protein kinase UbiB, partial [Burkholderiales bacterium]
WKTAKPYLERWLEAQIGWRGLVRTLKAEAPTWANLLPQLPRLAHRALAEDRLETIERQLEALLAEERRRNRWLAVLAIVAIAAVMLAVVRALALAAAL